MNDTIGNPLSWTAKEVAAVGRQIGSFATHVGHDTDDLAAPGIRHITVHDLREVLRKGVEDFGACRTDVIALCVFYPVIGVLLAWFAFDRNLVPLLFPVISGFALLGPVAGVGLYEMSRMREIGEEPSWAHAFDVVRHPSFAAIAVLGLMLGGVFVVWMLTAHGIYYATLGPESPASLGAFLRDTFTTGAGWAMIIVGCAVGLALRRPGARHQRRVLPAAPRPRRRAAGCGDHLAARHRRQPGADRRLGPDRRRRAW